MDMNGEVNNLMKGDECYCKKKKKHIEIIKSNKQSENN
jgi:hypothetical protein